MIESKGWKWEIVKEDKNSIWKNPSVESYYLLNRWKTQNKIEFLDLGCGLGRHSILFGKNNFNVHCFDISDEAISRTKKWAQNEGLTLIYTTGDMLKLPYKDRSMDCILCRNVISHTDTEGVQQIIAEIYRVLDIGAECYLTLRSKDMLGSKQKEWPWVDEHTAICMEEGPEYKVPHFYADYNLIKVLFERFSIISISQIEEYWERDGETHSSFHYHVLIRKE